MGRNYSNFIQAYVKKYQDNFVPNKFYLWSAISTVAAALERKAWLPWGHFTEFPNMYVFLVSRPGIGKSSAIRPAVNLLRSVNQLHAKHLRILPNKITEPKLLDLLGTSTSFEYKGKFIPHTSVYYSASEASSCFHDPYGGFAQTVTALYDGDNITKATVSRKEPVEVINPCFNLIAGCTFDYLSRLLTAEGVLGGFASRLTYVVQDEVLSRQSSWQGRNETADNTIDEGKLIQDLATINEMTGPFTAEEDFKQAWESWFPQFDQTQQMASSEKMQSLLVRKPTMLRKLSMIISAAEGDDMVLRKRHWDLALTLLDEVEKGIPSMIREGQSHQTNSQVGANNALIKKVIKSGSTKAQAIGSMVKDGFAPDVAEKTVGSMIASGQMVMGPKGLTLVGDPDTYL